MPHNGMEVEAQHSKIIDRVFCFTNSGLALEWIDRPPSLNDPVRMPFLHRRHVIVRAGRRRDGCFEIERHQDRLYARIREILDNFFFHLRDPSPLPVLRQRIHVRWLARDPLLGVGVAMNVDDSHKTPRRKLRIPAYAVGRPRSVRSALTLEEIISTSFFFETLPNADNGKSGRISRRSGSLYLAISFPSRKVFSSSKRRLLPSRNKAQAHIRSPRSGSGTAMQATFLTAGCERIRFSISSALIFSPPRLMRSFFRPSTI